MFTERQHNEANRTSSWNIENVMIVNQSQWYRDGDVKMWWRSRCVERISVRVFPRLVQEVVIVTVARRPWQQQQRRLKRRNHSLIERFHVCVSSQNTAIRERAFLKWRVNTAWRRLHNRKEKPCRWPLSRRTEPERHRERERESEFYILHF